MTTKIKFFLSLVLALSLLHVQAGGVFAAPARQGSTASGGVVQSITLETDPTTGVTIVIVDVMDSDQIIQSVRVSLETAITLGLVVLNGDGKPDINNLALGQQVEIDPAVVIPVQAEEQHPVGSALATFFSDVAGIDYETIMAVHDQGMGFGVIAQTLWLTTKLEGDAEVFDTLIQAKQTGDFSAFVLEDGSTPQNWGQLRKAILAQDKENGLGVVVTTHSNNGNGPNNNNGNGNDNGNNGNNGNNGKDKGNDKDDNKDKGKGNDKKK